MIHIDLDNNPFEVIKYHVLLTDKTNASIVYTPGKKIITFCKIKMELNIVKFLQFEEYKEIKAMKINSLLSDLFSRDYVSLGSI